MLNLAWFKFYGLKLGLSQQETVNMRYGEMLDLINCMAIYSGTAKPKTIKRNKTKTA